MIWVNICGFSALIKNILTKSGCFFITVFIRLGRIKTLMMRVASPSLGRVSSLLSDGDDDRSDRHDDSASDSLPE